MKDYKRIEHMINLNESLIWERMKRCFDYGYEDGKADTPFTDTVSRGAYEQVMWERDVAIGQLKELGYGLGQKVEPCDDAVSRKAVDELSKELVHTTRDKADFLCNFWEGLQKLPPVNPHQKYGKCKDCKWWRDSDGAYRRGVKAESRCPINTVSVANGWGYCYMFEPQESEKV